MDVHFLRTGPSNNATVLLGYEWTLPCAYCEVAEPAIPVLSTDPTAASTSHVRFVWKVDPAFIPANATFLIAGLKLEAYTRTVGVPGYAQANIRQVIPGEVMNHILHTEDWGRGPGYTDSGRQVKHVHSVVLPIIDGAVTLDVVHEIDNAPARIDFNMYAEGYALGD